MNRRCRPLESRRAWSCTLSAALFAVSLTTFVMLIPTESRACGGNVESGATVSTPEKTLPMPEEGVVGARPQAAVVSAVLNSDVVPARGREGCCGGKNDAKGASCSGGNCSECSTIILPIFLNVRDDITISIYSLVRREGVAFADPNSVFHPPRPFI
jgi:hypothetical protein